MKPGDLIIKCDRRTNALKEVWFVERITEYQSSPNEWATSTLKSVYIHYFNISKGYNDWISKEVLEIFCKDDGKSTEYLEVIES